MSNSLRNWALAAVCATTAGCGTPKMEPVAPPGMEYQAIVAEKEEDKAEALGEMRDAANQQISLPPAPPPNEPTPIGQPRTLENGLKYETLKAGEGPAVAWGQTIAVHYTGALPDGKEFDSSRKRGTPINLRLGAESVIKGWEIGLQGARVGEVRRLTIPPALAYGEAGRPPTIPPNSTLIFEVEVVAAEQGEGTGLDHDHDHDHDH